MRLILFFLSAVVFIVPKDHSACIDPPDAVIVSLITDTVDCEVIMEISNLRLMGGDPNHFCSCGINDQIAGIGPIQYVAFVDSATNVPVLGFDQFGPNSNADNAWEMADNSFDWNGFVSHVNEAGLVSGQAIKLWIRMDMYPEVTYQGVTFDPCEEPGYFTEEEFFIGAIGTDEWNDDTQSLMMDHMGIAYFDGYEMDLIIVEQGGLDEYDDIIDAFYTSVEENRPDIISVFPNPNNGLFSIRGTKPGSRFEIYSTSGALHGTGALNSGLLDLQHLPSGLYHLVIHSESSVSTLSLIKD